LKVVIAKAIDDKFRVSQGLKKRKTDEGLLLKSRYSTGESMVFALTVDPKDVSKTILATVTFASRLYSLERSEQASYQRDSAIRDLEGRLTTPFSRVETPDDQTSLKANQYALRPTNSKFSIGRDFLGELPRYHLLAIALAIALWLTLTGVFVLHFVNSDTFIGGSIIIAIAMIVDVSLSAREEMSRKTGK
jgi:hypothetical protein